MNVCALIAVSNTENEYGEITNSTETETEVYCAECPVSSNEFYSAYAHGIRASKCLVVNSSEYAGQMLIEYESERYSVFRTIPRVDGYLELYCERRIGSDI